MPEPEFIYAFEQIPPYPHESKWFKIQGSRSVDYYLAMSIIFNYDSMNSKHVGVSISE